MDRLAPEIISIIISYVVAAPVERDPHPQRPNRPLSRLATLCRRWQLLVEAFTFRRLLITANSLPLAMDVLNPRRLSYTRQVEFPFWSQSRRGSVYLRDVRFDLESFSAAVAQLFNILERIPLEKEPLVDLYLMIPESINIAECVDSLTQLPLPELPMIRYLKLQTNHSLDPFPVRRIIYMVSRMTRLREVNLSLSPHESTSSPVQKRIELARSLATLPLSIHNFSLEYSQPIPTNDAMIPTTGEDILSRELCRFSQREGLKDFTFRGSVEPTIFWPTDSDSDSNTAETLHWPTLKSFVIYPQKRLPSGKPLVYEISGQVRSYERIYPHSALVNEFFRAAARCVAHMPKAEYCSVDICDSWSTSLSFSTLFPEDPCIKIGGEAEIEEKTLEQWHKATEAHNLKFRVWKIDFADL